MLSGRVRIRGQVNCIRRAYGAKDSRKDRHIGARLVNRLEAPADDREDNQLHHKHYGVEDKGGGEGRRRSPARVGRTDLRPVTKELD